MAASGRIQAALRIACRVVTLLCALAVFAVSWLFRFNDPGGYFAGLTDDHFFYIVRGWQILYGDLPVRDFVDHGAPLFYYVAALVQSVARGTLSELVFSVSALSLGAALTFLVAARGSGSLVAALAGVSFQVLLQPRFYNYPKILVYAAAIPALWWLANRPSTRRLIPVAMVTAIATLLRVDHGVFVGAATATLLLLLVDVAPRRRLRLALVYGALTLALLLPYLLFIEVHGGLVSTVQQAAAWAERDRARAPVVWPGLLDNPDGESPATAAATGADRALAVVRDNWVAWLYYAEIALPLFALALLVRFPDGLRPQWPQARAKLGMVAVLALVLDVGFLRSPLAARLADPSVPHVVLMAWLLAALPALCVGRRGAQTTSWPLRLAAGAVAILLLAVLAAGATKDVGRRLQTARFLNGTTELLRQTRAVAAQLRADWRLESWVDREGRSDLIGLALYLNACTRPDDRVLVQGYVPQVLGLARRAFAGGHADLRPGFFEHDDAQRLTVARLRRQSVPVILLDSGESYQNFRRSFPLVIAYIDEHYRPAGTRLFDGRFGMTLFVRRDRPAVGTYAPFDWPCYADGRVRS